MRALLSDFRSVGICFLWRLQNVVYLSWRYLVRTSILSFPQPRSLIAVAAAHKPRWAFWADNGPDWRWGEETGKGGCKGQGNVQSALTPCSLMQMSPDSCLDVSSAISLSIPGEEVKQTIFFSFNSSQGAWGVGCWREMGPQERLGAQSAEQALPWNRHSMVEAVLIDYDDKIWFICFNHLSTAMWVHPFQSEKCILAAIVLDLLNWDHICPGFEIVTVDEWRPWL